MFSRVQRVLILTIVFILTAYPAHDAISAAVIQLHRADGSMASSVKPVGGLCMVVLSPAEGEILRNPRITAGSTPLALVEEPDGFQYWWQTRDFDGDVLLTASWKTDQSVQESTSRLITVRNVEIKLRIEVPRETSSQRTVYVTGNLFELGENTLRQVAAEKIRPDLSWPGALVRQIQRRPR